MKAIADGLANEVVKMKAPNEFQILKGPILKGFCPPAQGCEERATLGNRPRSFPTLKGLQHCLAVLGTKKPQSPNSFKVEAAPLSPVRYAELSLGLFPLTPALSLGERENHLPRCERVRRCEFPTLGRRCSLSPRERAGVRGKARYELKPRSTYTQWYES